MRRIKAAWRAFLNPEPKPQTVHLTLDGQALVAAIRKHQRRRGLS